MTIFNQLSIKNKMIGVILLVTSIAIVIGFSVEVARTNAVLKDELVHNAALQAMLIGEQCVVPLSFDDAQQATIVLATLQSLPSVESGYVYDDRNVLFASFQGAPEGPAPGLPNIREQAVFVDGHLHTYQPIIYKTKDYGTVYLRTSLSALDQKIRANAIGTIAVAILLIAASYFLAFQFQGLISKPILKLAEVSKRISAEGDYSLRVYRRGDDEIGLLYDAFNDMLNEIDAREDSLQLIHTRLNEAQRMASIGNWDWNTVSNELWWSDEIYRMFQMDPNAFGANYEAFLDKVHPEDRQAVNTAVENALDDKEPYSLDHRIVLPDGTQRIVHEHGEVTFNKEKQAIRMVGTVHDVTARKKAEDEVRQRVAYQALLVELSSELILAQSSDISEQIDRCIKKVGIGYELDSVSLWWVANDRDSMRSSHRWERAEGRNPPNLRGGAEYPWFAEHLRAGKMVVVDDVEKMPPQALAEQEEFRQWGTKSFLIIPILANTDIAGTCVFSTQRKKREWSANTIAQLKLVSENLAGALVRAQAISEIEELKDRLQAENIYLREEVRAAHGFVEIIGDDAQLRRSLDAVEKVAPTDVTVLILGETGTGKELIARAVHSLSARRDKPMVSVNCPALPTDLIESELFGHEKGAFTGAQAQRKGRFELANGGTLFLDELGELPLDLQSKLLRVLQTGEFQRLGGTKTLHSDVRLIAATNIDLKHAVERNEFRSDLYYRINSFPIFLPALRERKGDIPLLAEHFVRKHSDRLGKKIDAMSSIMLDALMRYSWPGNVRELESIIERALISSAGHSVLELAGPLPRESAGPPPKASAGPRSESVIEQNSSVDLSSIEYAHILKVLEQTQWLIAGKDGAAAALGMPSSTLRSKMKRLGISRNAT